MNWINAKDRLPKESGHYLVLFEDGSMQTCFYFELEGVFSDNAHYYYITDDKAEKMTHWIPIDAIPKPEMK